MAKQSLIQGTIILTVAAFFTKILGFLNGIVMANVIGPEGVGLIMMATPVTGLLITLTTIGLPVAISKLVAEAEAKKDYQRIKKILVVSLATTSIIGLLLMIVAFWGAKFLSSTLLADPRAYYSLLAVIPIVPIIAISSVIKGYFRGKQNMTPIALSQVIEQVVRIVCILIIVKLLLPYGIEYAAAGAVLSGIIGEAISLLYLLSMFKRIKRKQFKLRRSFITQISKGKHIFFDLLQTGLPTTGNGLIQSIIGVFQPIIITQSLALAGVGTVLATQQYGIVMGYVLPLLMLPGFITNSVSVPLIPSISEAKERNQLSLIHKRIQKAVKLSLVVGVPSTIILYCFAEVLTTVIYKSPDAGILLKVMTPFYLLQYFRAPLQSVLIALGKANVVMINDLVATSFKLILIFVLASNPDFGIFGVCIAISASVVLGTALHFLSITKLIGFTINLADFIKVTVSGIAMGSVGIAAFRYLSEDVKSQIVILVITLSLSLLIYLLFLISFKVISFRKKV
ncbi:stage V sporulation protein B [Bacillus sp. AK128]